MMGFIHLARASKIGFRISSLFHQFTATHLSVVLAVGEGMNGKRCTSSRDLSTMPFIVLGLLNPFMLRTDYGFNPYSSSAAWIYLKKLVNFSLEPRSIPET
jgi:hypothetical protein